MKQLVVIVGLCLSGAASADSVARQVGRATGEFGAGVGEAVGAGVASGMSALQPQWVTIAPRLKDDCLAESGGVINPVFIRCRNGRQELVRFDASGNKIVLSERDIPHR